MKNPTRRNRNIGTSSQGVGQNNALSIPWPNLKIFYERLGPYQKIDKTINGHLFTFVIEGNAKHACSVMDLERMIGYIPVEDYGEMKLIVLRQPKRKEVILSPVWGRLIYSYQFENNSYPAIILESIEYGHTFKWKRGLSLEDQKELARLQADGHQFVSDKRSFTAVMEKENVRRTQLYRTLLHEFGHYVQYMQEEGYANLSTEIKEKFAHRYADSLKEKLQQEQLIPFDSIDVCE
jgi:hypothetical protein